MPFEYIKMLRITYGDGLTFLPICKKCKRFVKSDSFVLINGVGRLSDRENATCSQCGRTHMIFEGWFENEE